MCPPVCVPVQDQRAVSAAPSRDHRPGDPERHAPPGASAESHGHQQAAVAGSAGPAEEQFRSPVQDEGHAGRWVTSSSTPLMTMILLFSITSSSFLCFSKMKGSDNQEKLVYQVIEDAGNKGIWSRDIRFKSNLPLTEVNKILKNLESKKLIKAVKSVAASKKKVYMLYNLQPDRSVTGGAWYSDQDFESEFVEVLNQQCFKFLQSKAEAAIDSKQSPMVQRNSSFATSHEVWKYICELGISKVDLSMDDIETILNTLIYDGKVEMSVIAAKEGTAGSVDGQMKLYRGVNAVIQPTGLVRTPCGLCPVFEDCHDGGEISPSHCVYMAEWLDF
uniref:Polymerase (RNA) III (DNA directed) polypeptide F n=1 Tax=Gasterosteus aculeatus aculeatus TaxID=481459 RepID=A0AAQ4P384_GASAC